MLYRIGPNNLHDMWWERKQAEGVDEVCQFCGKLTEQYDKGTVRFSYHSTKPLTLVEAILAELSGEEVIGV